jgi:hypothetical protein
MRHCVRSSAVAVSEKSTLQIPQISKGFMTSPPLKQNLSCGPCKFQRRGLGPNCSTPGSNARAILVNQTGQSFEMRPCRESVQDRSHRRRFSGPAPSADVGPVGERQTAGWADHPATPGQRNMNATRKPRYLGLLGNYTDQRTDHPRLVRVKSLSLTENLERSVGLAASAQPHTNSGAVEPWD